MRYDSTQSSFLSRYLYRLLWERQYLEFKFGLYFEVHVHPTHSVSIHSHSITITYHQMLQSLERLFHYPTRDDPFATHTVVVNFSSFLVQLFQISLNSFTLIRSYRFWYSPPLLHFLISILLCNTVPITLMLYQTCKTFRKTILLYS